MPSSRTSVSTYIYPPPWRVSRRYRDASALSIPSQVSVSGNRVSSTLILGRPPESPRPAASPGPIHGRERAMKTWLLKVGLALMAGAMLTGPGAHAQPSEAEKAIEKKIHSWVIENTRAGAQAEYFVVLERQADLSAARQLKGKLSRGQYVYETLFRTAQESQKAIRAELDARGVEYQSFYLVNAILVKGDRDLARKLAARPDVKRIDGNVEMRQTLP